MRLDEEMSLVIIEMLEEFGTDVTLTRTDPDTGNLTTQTIRAVLTDPLTYRVRPVELDQPAIRAVVTNKFRPIDTDRITHSRGTWVLTRVDPIQYSDMPMAYRIEGYKA